MQVFCKYESHKISIYKALEPVFNYSHSIVPGGLEEISYTILFIPFTLFIILFDTSSRNSYGSFDQVAVMKSMVFTERIAATYS